MGQRLLEIEQQLGAEELMVRPRGELDVSSAEQLRDVFYGEGANRAVSIVLDLSGLEFLDSAGLRAIVEISEQSENSGKRLRILPGPRNIQALFVLTGLEARLPFHGGDVDRVARESLVSKIFQGPPRE